MTTIFPGFPGTPYQVPGPYTDVERSQILSLLGYRNYQLSDSLLSYMRNDLYPYELERVTEIKQLLSTIDTQITEALADSAITQTCNTQMSWGAHLKMLRQQGHNLLLELARIFDMELICSKYASYLGRVAYTVQYQ